MRTHVMRLFRHRLVRSVALVSVVSVAAGCSADATRLQDGFYTGAIPQAPVQNTQVAGAPSVPTLQSAPSQTYAAVQTPSVSRSSLPPPPASSYGNPSQTYSASSQPISQAPVGQAQVAQTEVSRAMPAAQASAAAAGRSASVTVESGDSLLGIARRTGASVADIRAANGLSGDNIRIGQTLVIPGGSVPTAPANTRVASLGAPPTTLQAQAASIPAPRSAPTNRPVAAAPTTPTATKPAAQAAAEPARPAPAVAAAPAAPKASETAVAAAAPAPATTVAAEEEKQEASLAPASTGIDQFRWPVQGRVVKNFGDKVGSRRNDGLNISVPRGTPIKAAENGVVIYAGEGLKEFGKTVLVKHDNGLVTVYGHADDIMVQRGSTVKRGQEIAKAGMTGDAESPMLHFEVRKDSSPVNPMTYLR